MGAELKIRLSSYVWFGKWVCDHKPGVTLSLCGLLAPFQNWAWQGFPIELISSVFSLCSDPISALRSPGSCGESHSTLTCPIPVVFSDTWVFQMFPFFTNCI